MKHLKLMMMTIACLTISFATVIGQKPFTHTAKANNITNHMTTINNSATNGKSNALLFVTQVYSGKYNNHPFGVWYSGGKWLIYNENKKAMDAKSIFNVLAVQPSGNAFMHKSLSSNTSEHMTTINHPSCNGKPNVVLMVTQNWKGTYNPKPIAVWYDGSIRHWVIYNQDRTAIPAGTNFNVMVLAKGNLPNIAGGKTFVFTATAGAKQNSHGKHLANLPITGHGAKLFVTQNYGKNGPYNAHETAVWNDGINWTVYNKDKVAMPVNAKYNILAIGGTKIKELLLSKISRNKLSSNHWYNIEAHGTNKVIDVARSGTTDRTNIGLYPKHRNRNHTNQRFKFVSKGHGVYEIYAQVNPKSLLDDSSTKGANGSNIHLYTGKNKLNQRFQVLQDKDGYFYFKSMVKQDSYLGWKGSNLEIVKYTGEKSAKSMRFELHQWRLINKRNVPLHIVSELVTTKKNGGNVIKYDVKNIDYVPMKASSGTTMGKIKLNFEPETAKNNGFLYAYLKLNGAKIEMKNYISQKKKKGFYLKDLTITMTTKDGLQVKMDNPENINSEGKYTKSESYSIGANASANAGSDGVGVGAGVNGSYSWGSSFTRSVMDFGFTNETQGSVAQFHWNLSGGVNGKYENYRSLGVRSVGQYHSLSELPPMAKDNFPIDCEVLFTKYVESSSLPSKVVVNINIKATFEKTWLWNDDANEVETLFNGKGILVNPDFYTGELWYRFDHTEETTENNIEVELDLSKLK